MSIEKVHVPHLSSFQSIPLTRYNSVTELISVLKAECSGLQLVVRQLDRVLDLEILFIPPHSRLQGMGRSVMEALTKYADEQNFVLKLQPDDVFGTPQHQLVKFYKKFDFIADYARVDGCSVKVVSMMREPSRF